MINIHVIFIYLTTISLITQTGSVISNCWCKSLEEKVISSRNLLLKRYRRSYLTATSTVWSSGNTKALIERIYESLQTRRPFRIGVVGGSFSIPQSPVEENTWAANVTRWINVMLSSSECDKDRGLQFNKSNNTCEGRPILDECLKTTFLSNRNHEKPLFCEPFQYEQESAIYHSHSRPLHVVCGHTFDNDHRRCPVYIGSGKYAQISSAAKGNTQTWYPERHMNTLFNTAEKIDFLFWDYSRNDGSHLARVFLSFILRFIGQARKYHSNLAGMGIVYWMNTQPTGEDERDGCYGSFANITNSVADLHFPFLVKNFNPWQGQFRNLSLLTMSLPQFCRVAGCNVQDFLDAQNWHPSEMGNSRFADLVIWQFLRIFKSVHKIYCTSPEHSNNTRLNEAHISWVLRSNQTYHESNISDIYNGENGYSLSVAFEEVDKVVSYPIDPTEAVPSFHPDYPVQTNISVVATMPLKTPILGKPLPVSQLAILCAPGMPTDLESRVYMAHESIEANISIPLHWVEMDISSVMRGKCAGWAEHSVMSSYCIYRHDTEFSFEPNGNSSCRQCPAPDWAGFDYPHGYWNEMPMVKKVDIVIRISSDVRWTHICLNPFKPRFLWQTSDGKWEENSNILDRNHQLTDYMWKNFYSCFRKTFDPTANFYYLWYKSDVHFRTEPPNNNEKGKKYMWPKFIDEFGFINVA